MRFLAGMYVGGLIMYAAFSWKTVYFTIRAVPRNSKKIELVIDYFAHLLFYPVILPYVWIRQRLFRQKIERRIY